MNYRLKKAELALERVPLPLIVVLGLMLVLIIGVLDFLTGTEISFSIFYMLPVALVTWFAGKKPGYLVSLISAYVWLAADVLPGEHYSHVLIPVWNMLVRLGFFLAVALILGELRQRLAYEQETARTDLLTGIHNSRSFDELAAAEIERADRYDLTFTVAYLDVDDFKLVNDRYGHKTGDNLLQRMAGIMAADTRSPDLVARIGGDEFIILLPSTGETEAGQVLRRLQSHLIAMANDNRWPVSFSIGAAVFMSAPSSVDEMIRLADKIMYKAKNQGKNLILIEKYGRESNPRAASNALL